MRVVPIRQSFSGDDVPPTAPAALRAQPMDVQVGAMALARVNSEVWDTLPPTLQDTYRQAVVLAAMLIAPKDSKLVAYLIEGAMSQEFPLWDLVYRRQQTMQLAAALHEARLIVTGYRPQTLAGRMALLATDEGQARAQHKGRGF